jgi:hypothetical protein
MYHRNITKLAIVLNEPFFTTNNRVNYKALNFIKTLDILFIKD